MFSGDFTSISGSIQLLLTRVKESDEVDIDLIRTEFQDIFKDEVAQLKDSAEKEGAAAFYEELSEKLHIFDPLDREFAGEDGERTQCCCALLAADRSARDEEFTTTRGRGHRAAREQRPRGGVCGQKEETSGDFGAV